MTQEDQSLHCLRIRVRTVELCPLRGSGKLLSIPPRGRGGRERLDQSLAFTLHGLRLAHSILFGGSYAPDSAAFHPLNVDAQRNASDERVARGHLRERDDGDARGLKEMVVVHPLSTTAGRRAEGFLVAGTCGMDQIRIYLS